jgi:peptide/nickel transport system permease protein
MLRSDSNKIDINKFFNGVIFVYIFIALFAPILANEKPLFLSMNENYFFPAFSYTPYLEIYDENGNVKMIRSNQIDWKNLQADIIIFPLVCWSPSGSDLLNTYSSPFSKQFYLSNNETSELPFRFRHFLGTGKTGNDVLSGLIHGTRTSLLVGFFSILIAVTIGVLFGGASGFLGDDRLKIRRGSLLLALLLIVPAWYYSFKLRSDTLSSAFESSTLSGLIQTILSILIFIAITVSPVWIKFSTNNFLNKRINFPADSLLSRSTEIFLSLPKLILILTLASISGPSVLSIILIIGFTSWTETARLVRANVLQLKTTNFVAAAQASGATNFQIILHHLVPNSLAPIKVVFVYGIASAILVETGLSFLGIGVPAGTATWGRLMYEARENYGAWWLVVFSGMAIFIFLSSLKLFGERMKNIYKKTRQISS